MGIYFYNHSSKHHFFKCCIILCFVNCQLYCMVHVCKFVSHLHIVFIMVVFLTQVFYHYMSQVPMTTHLFQLFLLDSWIIWILLPTPGQWVFPTIWSFDFWKSFPTIKLKISLKKAFLLVLRYYWIAFHYKYKSSWPMNLKNKHA